MKNTISMNNELDNYGTLTDPAPDDMPSYDFGKLDEYCRKTGKSLSDMTKKEIESFRNDGK